MRRHGARERSAPPTEVRAARSGEIQSTARGWSQPRPHQAEHQDQAIRWFERTADEAPEDPITWYNLGAIYKGLARQDASFHAKAADAFKKAAELGPRDPDNLYYAGETAFTADRKEDARRFLESFLTLETGTQRAEVAKVLLGEL